MENILEKQENSENFNKKVHFGRGHGFPKELKDIGIKLLEEGMGIRSISRIVGCNPTTILYWRKQLAEKIQNNLANEQTLAVQVDEMYAIVK